jgi:uncharacterized protein YjbI with pentapeptide repeats
MDVVRDIARRRSARPIALAAIAAGVFVIFIYVLPGVLANGTFETDAARLKAENDVRATLLQGLAGAFLLLGLYFTGRTLQLNREGQITERFTRAIDQLGSTTLDVRLGGIYALERIANDSQNDRETIYAVLAAFIREHARQPDDASDIEEEKPPEGERRPREDVQTAATVLGRRAWRATDRELDLSRTDLRGVNLARANLEGANLAHANLEGRETDLGFARLKKARLLQTQLERANLFGANLAHATLSGANLAHANLQLANLEGADFPNANLADAWLPDANLAGADLATANLKGTHGIDLKLYLNNLPLDRQYRFLDLQEAFLESLSPGDLTQFKLSQEDKAELTKLAERARAARL